MSSDVPSAMPMTWASFIDKIILGTDPVEAAAALGYASPQETAINLMRHPQVRAALALAAEARLQGVSLPLALQTVEEILQDKTAPKAVRAKLALGILDRTRAKGEISDPNNGKSLADMKPRELEQLVAQLQASGVRPGQMLDVTPDAQGTPDKSS